MYVVEKIIEKTEGSSVDWRRGAVGNRSFPLGDYHKKDTHRVTSSELAVEVRELQLEELWKVCKWYQKFSEVEELQYRLEDLPKFYRKAGRRLKYERLELLQEYVKQQKDLVSSGWIKSFCEELLVSLDAGKIPMELKKAEGYLQNAENPVDMWPENAEDCGQLDLFKVLRGLDSLKEPMYVRIFSSRFLKDRKIVGTDGKRKVVKASKVLKELYQSKVESIAKHYHPDVDEEMNSTQILSQLYLEEYAQVLAVKGPLKLVIDGAGEANCEKEPCGIEKKVIDLSQFRYGVILNSQTLDHAVPARNQSIRKIITVENQANYEAMPYEDGTLIIFCHGYFTPREREFLKKLYQCLKVQEDCELNPSNSSVQYYHTGDLDYGGIRIFHYIHQKIFPELQPLNMDPAQFEKYRDKAEPLEPSTLEKLNMLRKSWQSLPTSESDTTPEIVSETMPEVQLLPLMDLILTTGLGIEQENWYDAI